LRVIAGLMACLIVVAGVWATPPEPDPVPTRWQLDLKAGPLRIATIDTPDAGPRAYFYFTYKVTNNSGEDLLFAPAFDMATENGDVRRADQKVPPEVTRELLRRLNHPFLQDQIGILGLMLQGEENAKFGLAVWPADDLDVDEISIYAAGFSGETTTLRFKDPKTGKIKQIVLRKTYMLRYRSPGELVDRGSRPITQVEARWIMR
jgi:hypothetical protein